MEGTQSPMENQMEGHPLKMEANQKMGWQDPVFLLLKIQRLMT
jgi:hypothetical protein